MLLIELNRIPADGLDVDEALAPGAVHVEGEEAFTLAGGRLACRVERSDDASLQVRGRLSARLVLECGRCLEPFEFVVEQDLDLFYLPHRDDDEEEDEVELEDRDMVVAFYRDERLDLGETVREQLFLSLPMRKLCRETCRGLCTACGVNRNAATCACSSQETADPRLAPLAQIFKKGSS